jgi:hypothetical protein
LNVPVDDPLKRSFQNMHGGYPEATLERFLRARDDNVLKASKMLIDSLNWRVKNDIDNVLARPIKPKEIWDIIRESQLIGFCGYCKKGRPVFAIGVGQSSYDKAGVSIESISAKCAKLFRKNSDIGYAAWVLSDTILVSAVLF